MTGESSAIQKYDVDFKKTPGTLSLTSTHIVWVPKVKDAMDRQSQAMNRAISGYFSKLRSNCHFIILQYTQIC